MNVSDAEFEAFCQHIDEQGISEDQRRFRWLVLADRLDECEDARGPAIRWMIETRRYPYYCSDEEEVIRRRKEIEEHKTFWWFNSRPDVTKLLRHIDVNVIPFHVFSEIEKEHPKRYEPDVSCLFSTRLEAEQAFLRAVQRGGWPEHCEMIALIASKRKIPT